METTDIFCKEQKNRILINQPTNPDFFHESGSMGITLTSDDWKLSSKQLVFQQLKHFCTSMETKVPIKRLFLVNFQTKYSSQVLFEWQLRN
jgi:hypothetical protein